MKAEREDLRWMRHALVLAARGMGKTSPNPMVGAVIVRKGRLVGEGFHAAPGRPHAEIMALRQAGDRARGATLYVTLEPCSHRGKRTPPCVPEILAAGVKRVVAAMTDPNPQVSGKGLDALRRRGVSVDAGLMERRARRLNEAYVHFMVRHRPFIALKLAATLDGRIAAPDGSSRWISGSRARARVHRMRAQADAVLVGIGTVLADDPELTARLKSARDPCRIVLDSRLRIPLSARLLQTASRSRVIVATLRETSSERKAAIEASGAEVWLMPGHTGEIDLSALIRRLAGEGIASLLVEGGARVAHSLLQAGWVDRFFLFLAPTLMGGNDALPLFSGKGAASLSGAVRLTEVRSRRIGEDLLIEGVPLTAGHQSDILTGPEEAVAVQKTKKMRGRKG